jgi:hypothetical protein
MEQLGAHWTDFHEIWYLRIFENLSRKLKFHFNMTRITGILREDHVSDRVIGKNKTHFMFTNFFRKSYCSWDNVEEYCWAERAIDYNMGHMQCMLDTYCYKHKLRISNTYCFATATMVTEMCSNVPLYVLCLSCYVIVCSVRQLLPCDLIMHLAFPVPFRGMELIIKC